MENSGYGEYLSGAYDALNGDVDYGAFASYYEACFARYANGKKIKNICEMACGSGSMALELRRKDYRVMAFDLSEDMLVIADKKAHDAGFDDIRFTCQDLTSFQVYTKADACLCMSDSFNCLSSAQALGDAFVRTHEALSPGGLFLFDINTRRKFEKVYADNAYILEDEHVLLAWQNEYRASTGRCDLYLTFFFEEADGRYTRREEHIKQKMFPAKTVLRLLDKASFDVLDVWGDTAFAKKGNENEDDKLYFICRSRA